MTYAISSPSKINQKLVKAVIGKNLEGVTQALAEGANPTLYLTSWYRSLLVQSIYTEQDQITKALMDAGANPWHPEKTIGSQVHFPAHTEKLRLHPQWGEVCLHRLDDRLAKQPIGRPEALLHLKAFTADAHAHPLERRYRDLLNRRFSSLLSQEDWWQGGLEAQTPYAMQDALDRKGMPEVDWVIQALSNTKNLQSADGAMPFIERLSPQERVLFFVGTDTTPGVLEALKNHLSVVRDTLWTYALNDPAVAEAMLHEDHLMTFLPLAMHQHASVTTGMLDQAKAQGINLGEISYQQHRQGLMPNDPTEDLGQGSLLDEHLNRRNHGMSVQVVRRLLQEGCQPTYKTLKLLAWHVSSTPMERKLTKLFDTLWDKGADPEPAGERPIWDFFPREASTGVGRRLEAAYRQRRMDRILQEPAAPSTVGRKPRL